jgi:hypothetical protein
MRPKRSRSPSASVLGVELDGELDLHERNGRA